MPQRRPRDLELRFPELWNFLGGHLHQDWDLDYADWTEAFDDFLTGTDLRAFVVECDVVLAECVSERELGDRVVDLGMGFRPKGTDGTTRGWMLELRDRATAAPP